MLAYYHVLAVPQHLAFWLIELEKYVRRMNKRKDTFPNWKPITYGGFRVEEVETQDPHVVEFIIWPNNWRGGEKIILREKVLGVTSDGFRDIVPISFTLHHIQDGDYRDHIIKYKMRNPRSKKAVEE